MSISPVFSEDGKIVSLAAEQQYLLSRWNTITDDEKKIISDMLDVMISKK